MSIQSPPLYLPTWKILQSSWLSLEHTACLLHYIVSRLLGGINLPYMVSLGSSIAISILGLLRHIQLNISYINVGQAKIVLLSGKGENPQTGKSLCYCLQYYFVFFSKLLSLGFLSPTYLFVELTLSTLWIASLEVNLNKCTYLLTLNCVESTKGVECYIEEGSRLLWGHCDCPLYR